MATLSPLIRNVVRGAGTLEEFFGGWPRFHDAEVRRLELDRDGPVLRMTVWTFVLSRETDDRGYFRRERSCLVRFEATGVSEIELSDFNHQNVLFGLSIEQVVGGMPEQLEVTLESTFGLRGKFQCEGLMITLDEQSKEVA